MARGKRDQPIREINIDPKKKPTVRDIAAVAGVCYATASRVLSGNTHYFVSPETQERVLEVARQMRYFPNPFARSLKTQRSYIIGICVHQTSHFVNSIKRVSNPTRIDPRLHGIYNHPMSDRYNIMIVRRDDNQDINEEEMVQRVALLDGMIFITPMQKHQDLLVRIAAEIPVVAEEAQGLGEIPTVSTNQSKGMYDAVGLLYQRDCRKIGFITIERPGHYYYAHSRMEGFHRAQKDLHLPFADEQLFAASQVAGEVYQAARRMIRNIDGLDALIVPRDNELIETIQAVREEGRHVGDDIKIISINETPLCRILQPGITAIHFPTEQVAEKAFDNLLAQIENRDLPPQHILLEPTIVERGSTGGVDVTPIEAAMG